MIAIQMQVEIKVEEPEVETKEPEITTEEPEVETEEEKRPAESEEAPEEKPRTTQPNNPQRNILNKWSEWLRNKATAILEEEDE